MKWSEYHEIKSNNDTLLTVRLPKTDVFARDRAYMEVQSVQAGATLVSYSITIGTTVKSSSEFSYKFKSTGEVLRIDITDIVAAAYSKITANVHINIEVKDNAGTQALAGFDETITYTADGYSPLLDFFPASAIVNDNILLTPPTRMLYTASITPSVVFLLNNKFNTPDLSLQFDGEDVELQIGLVFNDFSQRIEDMSQYVLEIVRTMPGSVPIKIPVYTLTRNPQLADACREQVLVSWRTPWGVEVEHLFYLGAYNEKKANAKQIDDPMGGYVSVSDIVRSGSFYLDAIGDEYDLWYYKSMMRADWVRVRTQAQGDLMELLPMPQYNSYYNVRVTGCSVGDIIADGINSKVLQFEFERED